MDTGVIIAIVVAALVLIGLLVLVGRRSRERGLEARREQASQIRREAEVGRAQADQIRAEADERAARARGEEAAAREQEARAESLDQEARERLAEANSIDPDTEEREALERHERGGVDPGGITSHGHET